MVWSVGIFNDGKLTRSSFEILPAVQAQVAPTLFAVSAKVGLLQGMKGPDTETAASGLPAAKLVGDPAVRVSVKTPP